MCTVLESATTDAPNPVVANLNACVKSGTTYVKFTECGGFNYNFSQYTDYKCANKIEYYEGYTGICVLGQKRES